METNIEIGEATVVNIIGHLDTISAPDFEKSIAPVLESDMKKVIVNCEEMNYISSSGLRSFLSLLKTSKMKNGELILKGINPNIKEVFEMTGFVSLFKFED